MKQKHQNTSRIIVFGIMLLAFNACTTTEYLTTNKAQQDPAQIDPVHPPALVELNFESHGERLNGILYQANGAGPHPTVVLLHGYPGNEKNLDLAQSLPRLLFLVEAGGNRISL